MKGFNKVIGITVMFFVFMGMVTLSYAIGPGIYNFKVSNGINISTGSITISPDSDGSTDVLTIFFNCDTPSLCRVIVDTNRDNTFTATLDWSNQKDWTWGSPYFIWVNKDVEQMVLFEGRGYQNIWDKIYPNGNYKIQITAVSQANGETTYNELMSVNVLTSACSGTISGTDPVKAATEPVPNINMDILNSSNPNIKYWTKTDTFGNYVVNGVRPGTYTVVAHGMEQGYTEEQGTVGIISIGNAYTRDLLLRRGGSIVMNILFSSASSDTVMGKGQMTKIDGSYMTGGDINVNQGDTMFLLDMGTGSRMPPVLQLPPGTYYGHIEIPGYLTYDSGPFQVTYGETITISDTITKLGRIYGVVGRPSGTAGDTVFVSIFASAVQKSEHSQSMVKVIPASENTITYAVIDLKPDTYILSAYTKGAIEAKYDTPVGITYASNIGIPPLLQWPQGSTINGILTVEGGLTFPSVFIGVNAFCPTTNYMSNTYVLISLPANTSSYIIKALKAGKYYLDASLYGYDPVHIEVVVNTDNETIIRPIVLKKPSGTILGSVTGINPADSSQIVVGVVPLYVTQGGTQVLTVNGSYKLSGISSGEYLLYAGSFVYSPEGPPEPDGKYSTSGAKVFIKVGETIPYNIVLTTDAGTIVGRVTYSNSQTLLTGKPVYAMPVAYSMGSIQGGLVGRIAPDGNYIIKGLAEGVYSVYPETYMETFGVKVTSPQYQIINVAKNSIANSVNFVIGNGSSISGNIVLLQPVPVGQMFNASVSVRPKMEGPGASENMTNIMISPNNQSGTFTISPFSAGEYIVTVYSKDYMNAVASVNITDTANINNLNFHLAKGTSIKGRVVDSLTGKIVPLAPSDRQGDGVFVHAEARPWKEGSWRSANRMFVSNLGEQVELDAEGKFTISNLPAGNYEVMFTCSQQTVGKTYVNFVIPNVVIPAYDPNRPYVDIGEVKLVSGVSISGIVTTLSDTPLANINVSANVAGTHPDYWQTIQATTQSDGFYMLKGISAEHYYDVIVNSGAGIFEISGLGSVISDKYGMEIKRGVPPGSKDVNFKLLKADAYVSGRLTKSDTAPLSATLGQQFAPGAVIVMKRMGSPPIGDNPMTDGLLTIAGPADSTGKNYRFDRGGIVPGKYIIKVFGDGYVMGLVENVQIVSGSNNIDTITLVKGASVTGIIVKEDGSAVTDEMAEVVVAATRNMKKFAAGAVSTNPTTHQVNSYSVKGLQAGNTYNLVVVPKGGVGVFIDNANIYPPSADTEIIHNIVMKDYPPLFHLFVRKEGSNFRLRVLSSRSLVEMRAEDVITKFSAKGDFSDFLMHDDKIEMEVTYTPLNEDSFTIQVKGHSQTGKEGVGNFKIYIGADAQIRERVNIYNGGSVSVGNGDNSTVQFDQGAIESGGDTGTVEITIDKAQSMLTASGAPKLAASAYPFVIPQSSATPGVRVSAIYNVVLNLFGNLFSGKGLTVTLDYDTTTADVNDMNIFYYNETTLKWEVETTNRSVDSTNHTVSVEVNHLSQFATFNTTFATGFDKLTTYNYPNPFKLGTLHTSTTIMVGLKESATVSIRIYNIAGELVRSFDDFDGSANKNYKTWDGTNDAGELVASGVYVYVVKTANEVAVNKIMVIR